MLWIVSCLRQHSSRRWTQCIINASDVFLKLNLYTIIGLLTHPFCLVRTSIWRNWPLIRAESSPLPSYTLKIALICLATYIEYPDSLETQATFMPSAAYRHTGGANRVGRPKPHWAESFFVEASRRINFLYSDNPPLHSLIGHEFYAIPKAADIRQAHASHSLVWMDNTPLYRQVSAVARNRASWVPVVNKPSRKTSQRS